MLTIENDGLPSGKHPNNLENPPFYSWVNPPFRLGHGFNSFLYVYQAGPKKMPAASCGKNCCLDSDGPAGTIILPEKLGDFARFGKKKCG